MSANRSAIGVVALWATFCVVLLAAPWLSGGYRLDVTAVIGPSHAASAASDSRSKRPPAPGPGAPVAEAKAAANSAGDPDATAIHLTLRPCRTAWVARVPLWPADALHRQRMEPALRLNPGHAPPYA